MSPLCLVRLGLYLALIALLSTTVADPDLWGHVRFGGDLAVSRSLPGTDPYSFTSDRTWVNHEWLAELLMYAAYNLSGPFGLVGLRLLVLLATFALVSSAIRRSEAAPLIHDVLLLLVGLGILARADTLRPQLFSLLLFTATLTVLVEADRGRRAVLFVLVPIFACWANLHGGFIVGLGVVVIWAAFGLLRPNPRLRPRILLPSAVAASALATLANPYGPGLWTFLRETVGFGRAGIVDWQPVYSPPSLLVFWVLPLAITGIALMRAGLPENRAYVAIVAVLGFASFRVSRLDAFFCLGAVMLLCPQLVRAWRTRRRGNQAGSPATVGTALVAGVAALSMVVPAGVRVAANVGCIGMGAPYLPEPEAAAFLVDNGIQGRLFTWFDYGEYAIWYLAPRVRVSIDGRRETVYSDRVLEDHGRAYRDGNAAAEYLRTLDVDYAWLPKTLPAATQLERHGWSRVFLGSRSVILARRALGPYRQPAELTARRCFPGP